MTFISQNKDFLLEVAKGNVAGHSLIQKFGHNHTIGTTYSAISTLGIYPTPQVSGATTLRIKAGGNANDTAAGSGAQEITLVGLDETGVEVSETLATAGVSASAITTTTFIRLYRSWVSKSGTYATQSAGSHSGSITIENGAGGTDWAEINLNGFPLSQTRIGAFSVPLGKTAYVLTSQISVETTKILDIIFFQRQGILKTSAPYDAMRMVYEAGGLVSTINKGIASSYGPFPASTDIGYLAKVSSGTAVVSIDFEILLVDD